MSAELNGELNKAIIAALLTPGVDTTVDEWKTINKRIVAEVDKAIAQARREAFDKAAAIVRSYKNNGIDMPENVTDHNDSLEGAAREIEQERDK